MRIAHFDVTCTHCGARIYGAGNTRKYCLDCQGTVWKERENARKRRVRLEHRGGNGEAADALRKA